MTGRSDHLGVAVDRARARKVFGLPPLVTRFDIEVDAWNVTERAILGDLSNWKPTGLLQAMADPAPGYVEVANADGIRWHQRIADDA